MINRIPQQFGEYHEVEVLKRGGEAIVCKGVNAKGELVAIRLLPMHENPVAIQRHFEREVKQLQQFKHPHIITLEASGMTQGYAYLVMPYIPDGSLADLARSGQQFTFDEVVEYILQTANALSYAHGHNITHRDVKPDNLLRGSNGILLSDFGIARDGEATVTIARGTPPYCPPEQIALHTVPASDQYALAVTACWLFTGKFPAKGGLEDLRTMHPEIAFVLEKALEPDPARRYPSMVYFERELEHAALARVPQRPRSPGRFPPPGAMTPRPSLTSHSQTSRRSRRWLLAAILSLLLLVIIGAGTVYEPALAVGLLPPLAIFHPPSTIIKIATDLPTSGLEKEDGLPVQDGVDMAIQQANDNHTISGYTLVPAYKDDTGKYRLHDPQVGAENVNALIQDGLVAGIIGPFNSNVAQAEIPLANQAPIPLLSPSNTYPCLTKSDATFGCSNIQNSAYFRLPTTDDVLGKKLADYLFYQQGYHTVSMIEDQNDPYSSALAQAFIQEWESKTIGGKELGPPLNIQLGQTTQAQYNGFMQGIAPLHPDVVFFSGLMPDVGYVRNAMAQIPDLKKTPFAGGSGIVTNSVATSTGGSGPVFGVMPLADPDTIPAGQSFKQQFSPSYPNEKYRVYAASAYDCTNILIQAIKQALVHTSTSRGDWDMKGATAFRQAVIAALRTIPYSGGVTGNYTFDKNGDSTNGAVSVYQLVQTDWQLLPCNNSSSCFKAN